MNTDDWVLKILRGCERTSIAIAERLSVAAEYHARIAYAFRQMQLKHLEKDNPSLQQWANRLIEYIDEHSLLLAYEQFAGLINKGVEPEHAFHIVIGSAV